IAVRSGGGGGDPLLRFGLHPDIHLRPGHPGAGPAPQRAVRQQNTGERMKTSLLAPAGIALLAVIGTVLSLSLDSYSLLVFSFFALTVVVGVGLNILIGLSGQISFGHIAFYAIGAYASALLTMAGLPLLPAMFV